MRGHKGNHASSHESGGYDAISGTIGPLDAVQFDTTFAPLAHATGLLHWNDDDGTLEVGLKGNDVFLQIGQELVARVKNSSGVDIKNGQPVQIAGGLGSQLLVQLADASTYSTAQGTIGLATNDIDDGQFGYVTLIGLVRGGDGITEPILNTNTWPVGTILYITTTAGVLSSSYAAAPNAKIAIGVVVRQHLTEGVIGVRVSPPRIMDGISDVSAASPNDLSVLMWDDTNNYWRPSYGSGEQEIRVESSSAADAIVGLKNTNGHWSVKTDDSTGHLYIEDESSAVDGVVVVEKGANANSLHVDADGHLAVNMAPTGDYHLEVECTTGLDLLQFTKTGISSADAYFRISGGTSNPAVLAPIFQGRSNGLGYPGVWILGDMDNGLDTSSNYPCIRIEGRQNNLTVVNRRIVEFVNKNTVLAVLMPDGFWGILTTSPTCELDVNGDIRQKVHTDDISNPPTDAELDAIHGTPATVGAGFTAYHDDNGAGSNFYQVASDGANWWVFTGTKAV